LEKDKIR